VVRRHFGVAVVDISNKWGDMFYLGGPTKAAHPDDECRCDRADADKRKYSQQKTDRRRRQEMRDGRRRTHDAIDPVMIYRFKAMEPKKVRVSTMLVIWDGGGNDSMESASVTRKKVSIKVYTS
jgi:hypothetical protein